MFQILPQQLRLNILYITARRIASQHILLDTLVQARVDLLLFGPSGGSILNGHKERVKAGHIKGILTGPRQPATVVFFIVPHINGLVYCAKGS